MSVFSKIKMSKRAAKQHKEKEKEKEAEPVKVAYKHVPTHAAFDALNGAPPSWTQDDRSKIREQHKRRSQMALSRTGSSLSTMSYLNSAAGPNHAPPLPRTTSYNSYNPTWFDRGGDVGYSVQHSEPTSKRRKSSRAHSYHDSGIGPSIGPSPLASNVQSEEVSPVVSSGNSQTSSSSDHLEMAQNSNRNSVRPQPMVYADKDIFDRLHTSTTRKLGEAPLHDSPPVFQAKTPVVSTVTAVPQKAKKQRWSLLGKKQKASSISAI